MNKFMEAVVFVFAFSCLLSLIATDKQTFTYVIIGKNGAPPSRMNPSPVNDPTRGCNPVNHCRHSLVTVENLSGSPVEAIVTVKGINTSEVVVEAIAAGFAAWLLNKTNDNGYGRLRVSSQTSGDGKSLTSAERLQIKAVSRGINREGLDAQYGSAMSTEDAASLLPVGNITIAVNGTASNQVELKLFTPVESIGENDMEHILKHAIATLPKIQEKKD